jgi:hypothetical protein
MIPWSAIASGCADNDGLVECELRTIDRDGYAGGTGRKRICIGQDGESADLDGSSIGRDE